MEDFSTQSKIPLVKKMDRTVFVFIDKFKGSNFHASLVDFYSSLEDEKQKLMKASLLVFIIAMPLILFSFLFWSNYQLKKDLQARVDLITKANEIIEFKKNLQEASQTFLSSTPISKFLDLENAINNVLKNIGFDVDKIDIKPPDEDPLLSDEEINSISANIVFTNLATSELMNVFINLMQREKFQVHQVSIVRNDSNNLLSGSFKVVHLSKSQQEELNNGL